MVTEVMGRMIVEVTDGDNDDDDDHVDREEDGEEYDDHVGDTRGFVRMSPTLVASWFRT